jgi:hypothetical protein
MTRSLQNRFTKVVAITLPCTVLLSLVPGLAGIGPSTSAAVVALMIVATAIIVNTWKNGHPAGSVGQLIHETDMMPVRVRTQTTAELSPASRLDAWEKRHEGFTETGRDRALLMLSVAITAVLLYVRLS